MGIWAGAAQHGPVSAATQRQNAGLAPPVNRKLMLEALADRVEDAGGPDWELDLEIYRAFGFSVKEKATRGRGRGSPGGGIYQQGQEWKAVGHLGSDPGLVIDVIASLHPQLDWSLHGPADAGAPRYRADVAGRCAVSTLAGGALCAAALRAVANEAGPRMPGGVRPPSARQAG